MAATPNDRLNAMELDPDNPVLALCAAGRAVAGDAIAASDFFTRAWRRERTTSRRRWQRTISRASRQPWPRSSRGMRAPRHTRKRRCSNASRAICLEAGRILVGPINDDSVTATLSAFDEAQMSGAQVMRQTDQRGKTRHVVWSERH
jgi:hypothetical protein